MTASFENDRSDSGDEIQGERRLWPAVARGLARRCPRCGKGAVLRGYLGVADACETCGQPLHHARADDMPAWATIIITGHLLAPLMLTVEQTWSPSLWVYAAVVPPLVIGMALLLLPRIKGAVIGMQWALEMHGFGSKA